MNPRTTAVHRRIEQIAAELLDLFRKTHGLWLAENAGSKPKTTTYKLNLKLKGVLQCT